MQLLSLVSRVGLEETTDVGKACLWGGIGVGVGDGGLTRVIFESVIPETKAE